MRGQVCEYVCRHVCGNVHGVQSMQLKDDTRRAGVAEESEAGGITTQSLVVRNSPSRCGSDQNGLMGADMVSSRHGF